MNLIECRDVRLCYENHTVLSDLSFSVAEGDYLCILGENGSGKSTLIRALLSLHPVAGGTISYHGIRRDQIGYLPQQNELHRDFPASVGEVVLSGCLNARGLKPFYSRTDHDRAAETMKKLGIAELSRRCFRELSGGQQQRVLLARALCAAGRLILLDEPVSGLDPLAAAELYEAIRAVNREGMAVIMVSHDVDSAVHNAAHILHLQNESQFFGTTEAYLQTELAHKYMGGHSHV